MTLGSLFDGIGGWFLAARHAGVTPVWSSEIEPFPCAVTAHHFPDVTQMGDITKIDRAAIPPVDIVCAGSPCQGLSLAGKRRGLDDERSGLFRRAVDIVRAMRRATGGRYPRFFVWENVPGAFNSNKRMSSMAKCKECGKEIRWIKTTAGKAMPVDPKLVPYWVTAGGTDRIVTTEGKTLSCAWKGDRRDITGMGYVPHWATCAARQTERKARASAEESTMQGCLF